VKITFLGTGTSQGVPMLAHPNEGLDLSNPKNWRTRSSIHVQLGETQIQVDTAPDFRSQCLRESIDWIDLVIITHAHSDHVLGMDDLRRYCSLLGETAMPVYSTQETLRRIQEIFPYAVRDKPQYAGYPAFSLNLMPETPQRLVVPGGYVYATRLPHGDMETLGLVFEEKSTGARVAYYCDCKRLTPIAREIAQDVDFLILDGLRPNEHPTHLSIPEAVEETRSLGMPQTYLTHMCHLADHDTIEALLPQHVRLAYDGLAIEIK
jgi:phosphoribosyl 1,2-cyclic phosphate phosphodiesterase